MDDIEELRRKRAIKVIIADLIMAFSVIAIVFILVRTCSKRLKNSQFSTSSACQKALFRVYLFKLQSNS